MALRRIALIVLLYAICGYRCEAQFLGFVGQQTVQQTLGTSRFCTGAEQVYPINNLGQVQHYLSVANVVGATSFHAEIDGIDNQGSVYRISDVMEIAGSTVTRQNNIRGSGYYPQIQVAITCSPNTAIYTASYSGAQFSYDTMTGSFLTAQIDKINFAGLPGNANQQDNFQTPFGTSAGTVYFKYTGGSAANGTLSVTCTTNGIATSTTALSVTLVNTTALQVFVVPDQACPFMQVAYANSGTVGTVTAEYVFAVPGITNRASADPCASGTYSKFSSVVSAAAAATTQILAANSVSGYYVCGYQLSQVATAGTVAWVYGTGASCGTGTTTLMGPMGVTASQPFTYGAGDATIMKVPDINALCITATGAGGTVSGIVTYVQAP